MPAQSRAALLVLSFGNLAFFVASTRVDTVDEDHGDTVLAADGLVSQEKNFQHSRSEWSRGFEPTSCVEASFEHLDVSVIDAYFGDRETFNKVCGLAKIQSAYLPDLFNANIQNEKDYTLPGLNDKCLELAEDNTWKLFDEFQTGGKLDMTKVYEWGKEYSAELHARMEAHGACKIAKTSFDVSQEYTDFFVPAFQWNAGFEPKSCVETNPDHITLVDMDDSFGAGTFEEICKLAKTPVVSSDLFNPVLQKAKDEIPGLNEHCLVNFDTLVKQFDGSAADSTKVQVWGTEYSAALYKVMTDRGLYGRVCGNL